MSEAPSQGAGLRSTRMTEQRKQPRRVKGRYVLGMMDATLRGTRNCEAAFTYELDADGRFSMSAEVWNPLHTDHLMGGQCVEEVLEAFPDDAQAVVMAATWRLWHLNHMRAGCEHQRALEWGHGRTVALSPDDLTEAQRLSLEGVALTKVEGMRRETFEAERKRLLDGTQGGHMEAGPALHTAMREQFPKGYGAETERAVIRQLWDPSKRGTALARAFLDALQHGIATKHPAEEFKGAIYENSVGAPCPECGYRYGTKWLKEELPADVVEAVRGWPDFATPHYYGEEDASLAGVLGRLGVTMGAEKAALNPNMDDEHGDMSHWRCTFTRPDGGAFEVFYSMGSAHGRREPKPVEVLGCVIDDDPGPGVTFEDWCGDFGYDVDSRKAERTFQTCFAQAEALSNFLGSDVFHALTDPS